MAKKPKTQQIPNLWLQQIKAIRTKDKNLPIHLLIGHSGSGKKALLQQLPHTQLIAGDTPEHASLTWWQNDQAIFLVASSTLNVHATTQDNQALWHALLSTLDKQGILKRIKTLKILLPTTDLPYAVQRNENLLSLKETLQTLQNHVDYLPTFLLITASDKIRGFAEFFEDQHTQDPPIVQLTATEQHRSLLPVFDNLYQHMLGRIQHHLLPTLQRNQEPGRLKAIYALPNQMAALAAPIKQRLQFLGLNMPLPIQGIRFISAHNQNNCLDFTKPNTPLMPRQTLCLNEAIFVNGALTLKGLDPITDDDNTLLKRLLQRLIPSVLAIGIAVLLWQQASTLYQWDQQERKGQFPSLWHRLAFLKHQQQSISQPKGQSLVVHSLLQSLINGKLARISPAALRAAIASDLKAQMQSTVPTWPKRMQAWYLYKYFNQPNQATSTLYQQWLKDTWQTHFTPEEQKRIWQSYHNVENKQLNVALDLQALLVFEEHFQTLPTKQAQSIIEQALLDSKIALNPSQIHNWCQIFPSRTQNQCQQKLQYRLEQMHLTHYQQAILELQTTLQKANLQETLATLKALVAQKHPIFGHIERVKHFCTHHDDATCHNAWAMEQTLRHKTFQTSGAWLIDSIEQTLQDPSGQSAFEAAEQLQAAAPSHAMFQVQPLSLIHEKLTQHYQIQLAHFLNTKWEEEVYDYYKRHILHRYPLDPHATEEINLERFRHFFGPGGVLSAYAHAYLAPMIQIDQDTWTWKTIFGKPLNEDPSSLVAIQKAFWIQQVFFQGQQDLNWHFVMVPEKLHSDLQSFDLRTREHFYHIDHKTQANMSFHWPNDGPDTSISIKWTDQAGSQMLVSHRGPWAWFHLLQNADIEPSTHSEMLHVTFHNQGLGIRFRLIAQGKINPFLPSMIPDLVLPEKLL